MSNRLASSFRANAPRLNARPGAFLTTEELRAVVPSIFADGAHDSRSSRYAYVPTAEIVEGLAAEGFLPTFACQAKPRAEDRFEFAKHMIRFRRGRDFIEGGAAEVILVNSHDGTTSYQLMGGVYRFVCQNGMICGDTYEEVRVQHTGNILDQVIEGAYTVCNSFDRVKDATANMQALELSRSDREIFAAAAAMLRFNAEDETDCPIDFRALLNPRRPEDNGHSLWATLNTVQENVIRGGLSGSRTDANGATRRLTTRPVNGIDQNVDLNRGLWTAAEKLLDLRRAA